jgi:5-formyltetrahydrofolate cyclo-ligase
MRQPLRQRLKAERQQVEPATRMAAAEAVAIDILAHLPSSGGYLAGYWATDGELPLHIVQLRLPTNWIWCLPVIMPEKQLRFAPWRGGDPLISNQYGIPEPALSADACLMPEAMNAVIVPVVGFTRAGMRLGMGGGYYDASFAFRKTRPAPPLLIGAAYTCQQLGHLDAADWDVRLDAVATERGWIDCAQQGME